MTEQWEIFAWLEKSGIGPHLGISGRISEVGNSDMKEMVRIPLLYEHFELPYGFIQLFTIPVGKNWTAIIIFAKWHGNYATSGKKNKKWKLKKKNHNSLRYEFLGFYNLWIEMHFPAHRGILNI